MPQTDVWFYADSDGTSEPVDWLDRWPDEVRDKLFYRVRRLAEAGHELRRPEADILRDKIYELRVRHQRVNYRLLYFFHHGAAVIAHGCTKKGDVDDSDIERAIARRKEYIRDPSGHRVV